MAHVFNQQQAKVITLQPKQQPITNVDTPETITHVSLCSGYGGIDLGLRAAVPALRTIAYCEREAFPISILLRRIEEGQLDVGPIHTNLKAFPWELFRDQVSILSGGYPCQPFSSAGNRKGKDDPRHLWPWIADGIRAMQPKQCFFENVEGHVSLGLEEVIRDLEELGYKATWGIFSASEVGAPHQRKRVFILADRIDEGSQGRLRGWSDPERKDIDGHLGCGGSGILGRWPARPGEHQYEWEPPRVLENTKQLGRGGRDHGNASRDSGEVQTEGSRSCEMGNPECIRLESAGDQGAVGETCGGSVGEGSQLAPTTQVSSDSGRQQLGYSSVEGLEICGGESGQVEQSGSQPESQRSDEGVGDSKHARSHGIKITRGIASAGNYDPSGEDGSGQLTRAGGPCFSGDLRDQEGSGEAEDHGKIESEVCGDPYGTTNRVGYAELCRTYDNRTHELRALGNGVVWQQAALAYRTLVCQLLAE